MQQIKCEMCGSTDLVKKDGIYVCNNCGTKYSAEDAKKLLVTIDNSEKIDNLMKIANQSLAAEDYENAANYYDKVLQEDGDNWEAYFYNVICRAYQTRIINIGPTAELVAATIKNTIAKILVMSDKSEQDKAAVIVAARTAALGETLEANARSTLKSNWETWAEDYGSSDPNFTRREELVNEYKDRVVPIVQMLMWAGGVAHLISTEGYQPSEAAKKTSCLCQKLALKPLIFLDAYYAGKPWESTIDTILNDIVEFEPTYILPERPDLSGFPLQLMTIVGSNNSNNSANNTANNTSGGCYVATAVYGSYDCPQVWTLRRYRDYRLAETWYGRIFIHTYYAVSPTLVKWFGDTSWFKQLFRGRLDHMVEDLQNKGYESTPYEDRSW